MLAALGWALVRAGFLSKIGNSAQPAASMAARAAASSLAL
jgi:hypothetical protein